MTEQTPGGLVPAPPYPSDGSDADALARWSRLRTAVNSHNWRVRDAEARLRREAVAGVMGSMLSVDGGSVLTVREATEQATEREWFSLPGLDRAAYRELRLRAERALGLAS